MHQEPDHGDREAGDRRSLVESAGYQSGKRRQREHPRYRTPDTWPKVSSNHCTRGEVNTQTPRAVQEVAQLVAVLIARFTEPAINHVAQVFGDLVILDESRQTVCCQEVHGQHQGIAGNDAGTRAAGRSHRRPLPKAPMPHTRHRPLIPLLAARCACVARSRTRRRRRARPCTVGFSAWRS
jgi:hypothetical protein